MRSSDPIAESMRLADMRSVHSNLGSMRSSDPIAESMRLVDMRSFHPVVESMRSFAPIPEKMETTWVTRDLSILEWQARARAAEREATAAANAEAIRRTIPQAPPPGPAPDGAQPKPTSKRSSGGKGPSQRTENAIRAIKHYDEQVGLNAHTPNLARKVIDLAIADGLPGADELDLNSTFRRLLSVFLESYPTKG
jgi:hypothetical protein